MDTARTALAAPPSSRTQASSDAYPIGLTIMLAMLVALAVIIGIVFYIAHQMPV